PERVNIGNRENSIHSPNFDGTCAPVLLISNNSPNAPLIPGGTNPNFLLQPNLCSGRVLASNNKIHSLDSVDNKITRNFPIQNSDSKKSLPTRGVSQKS